MFFGCVMFKAGLIQYKDSKQLLFALEPEAASVCCRNLEFKHLSEESEENNDMDFPPGTKYMIIDAGGNYNIRFSDTYYKSQPNLSTMK